MKDTEINEHIFSELIKKKIIKLSTLLNIEVLELRYWLESYKAIDERILLSFLHLALKNGLDPLLGEVAIWHDDQTSYPAITIDGWIKLINQHPAFMAIAFDEHSSSNGQELESIACTITRSDRAAPICVQEYLEEVKNDQELWKTMPRRMLRHRALQQCARLAFGISTPDPNLSSRAEGRSTPNEIKDAERVLTSTCPSKSHAEAHSLNESIQGHLETTPLATSKLSRTRALKQRLSG